MNFLFQHVLTTMIHDNNPYRRTTRHYHLCEEIAERSGQVAAMDYSAYVNVKNSPVTPAVIL
jgi:hypothetical protein